MALINLLDVTLGFGGPPLLDQVNLQLDTGERVCLTGRNGAGKSSLMKLIAGELKPDAGQVVVRPGERVAWLRQEVPEGLDGTVREIVRGGSGDPLQPDWERERRIDRLMEQTGLDPDEPFPQLSAGMKRRVMLARGLADDPALLLLDEPTNHLDIDSIRWLESFLAEFAGALLFVTHDRVFLRNLATRILDLERGQLTSWDCDYDTFLRRRNELLEAEAKQQAVFDKKLAEEEAWLRRGIKARRTRNEGRVRALKALREERRARRDRQGSVRLSAGQADLSGVKVIEADDATFAYPGAEPLIRGFSTTIVRGDRVGILGPNGAGKSTLLNLLLGKLNPTEGVVKLGTRLEIAYFDQLRGQLDGERTVRENLVDEGDTVRVNGVDRHVITYLRDFLFTPDRANSPVKSLSGGERNRLLLARLFTRPSNLLMLDEPTNDLDAETLELLEECLLDYQGTLLLVSHDRAFLDNVTTSLLVLEGGGQVGEYTGGYEDYERARMAAVRLAAAPSKPKAKATGDRPRRPPRMTNREKRELEELPGRIENLESRQQELNERLAAPDIYQDSSALEAVNAELAETARELESAMVRWEELETKKEELGEA